MIGIGNLSDISSSAIASKLARSLNDFTSEPAASSPLAIFELMQRGKSVAVTTLDN
jgi:hypothetical protein